MKKKIIAKISSLLCMTMVVTGVYTPMIPVYAALKDDIKLCDDKVESHPITEDSKALVEETQVLSDTDDDIISVAEEEKELSLVKGVPETVYTVRLKTDESYSTSDPIYFYSNSSSIAASKEEAGSAQFYRADGGKLGFKLPDDYLPTSFEVKPYEDDNKTHYDYIFNGWSTVEGCTPDGTGCYILNSQTLTFITKWKQSQNQGLWLYERNSSNTKCIITDFNESTKSRQYYSDLVIPSHIDGMEVTDIQMSLESFKNINNLYLFEDSCFDKMPIISNQYLQHINIIDARGVVIKKDCLPDSVKTIVGNGLGIHILKKLTLPGVIRVETRRKGAFEGNISLESVIFKKTAAIDADAFSNINHELSISYPGSCSDWPYEIYRNSRGISVNCLDGTCGWCGADNSNNNTHWIMDNAGNLTIDSFGSNPDLYEQYKKYQVPYKGNWGQANVKSVTFKPEGIPGIGDEIFSGCVNLKSIALPNSITRIGKKAFSDCTSLKDIYFDGTKEEWNAVSKGDDWDSGLPEDYKVHLSWKVDFDAGEGVTVSPNRVYTVDEKLPSLPTPEREGWTFNGWYTKAEGGDRVTLNTIFEDDTTIYAHWYKGSSYTLDFPDNVMIDPDNEFTAVPLDVSELTFDANAEGKTPSMLRVVFNPGTLANQASSKTIPFKMSNDTDKTYIGKGTNKFNDWETAIDPKNIYIYVDKVDLEGAAPGTYSGSMSYATRLLYPGNKWSEDIETGTIPVTLTIQDINIGIADAAVSITEGDSIERTYGDPDFTLHASAGNTGSGTGTWTYTSSDVNVATVSDTGTVSIKGQGECTIKAAYTSQTTKGEAAVTLKVNKKLLTLQLIPAARAYERANRTVSFNSITLLGAIDGDDVSIDTTRVAGTVADANAGADKEVIVTGLTLDGEDAGNYTFDKPSNLTVTISPAVWSEDTGKEITKAYRYSDVNSEVYDMKALLPEDCGTVTYSVPVVSGTAVYEKVPAIRDGLLTYTLAKSDKSAEGTITVKARTQNYSNEFSLTVRISQQVVSLFEKIGDDLLLCACKELIQGESFTLIPMFVEGGVVNRRVVWASTNPDVATVTQDGKVTAMAPGITVIEVLSEESPSAIASCEVRVKEAVTAINLDKSKVDLGMDERVTLNAQVLPFTAGQMIEWSVDKDAVVNISPSQDTHSITVLGLTPGSAKVTAAATDGSGKKATCTFNVGNPVPDFSIEGKGNAVSVPVGKTLAMSVDWGDRKNTPKNTEIKWSVAKPNGGSAKHIASISDKGFITGISEGKVKVTATSTANPSKACSKEIDIYVPLKSAKLNVTSAAVSKADTAGLQLSVEIEAKDATGPSVGSRPLVTYSFDKTRYGDMINVSSTGLIKAKQNADVKKARNIPVTATVKTYDVTKTLTCKVSVTESNPLKGMKLSKTSLTMGEGNIASLTATLNPVNPDGSRKVNWKSSDSDIVTVDSEGNLTAKKAGTATITATTEGTVKKGQDQVPVTVTCKVTVKSSVSAITLINKETLSVNGLAVGKSYGLKTSYALTGAEKAASTVLKWTSSDPSVATVSDRGSVMAVAPGRVTVTATSADEKAVGNAPSASVTFDVYAAVKMIKPDKTKLTIGTQEGTQYGMIGIAAVAPLNVTDPSVEWKSNNANVKLAAIGQSADPSLAAYTDATGSGVTVGKGQYLAVMAVTPGVTKLTGITTDGSNKKMTCTVTVRGKVTGLSLVEKPADRSGYNNVTLSDNSIPGDIKYTGIMKAGTNMTLTPVLDINGVSGSATDKTAKNMYATYKRYTDMSVSYRSDDISILTVDNKGKISVKKNVSGTATVYIRSADGSYKAEIKIVCL